MSLVGRRLFAAAVVALFVYVCSGLLLPVFMGGMLAAVFFPWVERIEGKRLPSGLASALVTLAVTLLFLLPTSFLVFVGAKAGWVQVKALKESASRPGGDDVPFFQGVVESPRVRSLIDSVGRVLPVTPEEIAESAETLAKEIGLRGADLIGMFLSQLPRATLGLALSVVSLYFFLADGRRLAWLVRRNPLFDTEATDRLINLFLGLCRSVLLASVFSGAAQCLVYLFGLIVTGTPNAALITLLVFLCSFLPLIGAGPVTVGVAVHQLLIGNRGAGITLLVFAGGAALIDNVVRPMVLKGAGNLHPLVAFISALGGVQAFGFIGIFMGPLIAGMALALLRVLMDPEPREVGPPA